MNKQIPYQLRNPDFRFYLIKKNEKLPMMTKWNSINNFMFFEEEITTHLRRGGNVGICTGYGGLIIIDFDDSVYQSVKETELPPTFTVRTAIKRLKHYYYILEGEMIKKIGIGTKSRLADIQAHRNGIVCPPSTINRLGYDVIDSRPITKITIEQLRKVMNVQTKKPMDNQEFDDTPKPEEYKKTMQLFKEIGITKTSQTHYKCPMHPMNGNGNLYVFPNGNIHCFHCGLHKRTAEEFKKSLLLLI